MRRSLHPERHIKMNRHFINSGVLLLAFDGFSWFAQVLSFGGG